MSSARHIFSVSSQTSRILWKAHSSRAKPRLTLYLSVKDV